MSNLYICVSPSNGFPAFVQATRPGDLLFYTENPAQRMFMGATQNNPPLLTMTTAGLGVNKSNPAYSLDVSNAVRFMSSNSNPSLTITHSASNNAISAMFQSPNLQAGINNTGILFGKNGSNFNAWQIAHMHNADGNSSNWLGFISYGDSWRLVVTQASNVGIDTTSPQFMLDVNGACTISSNCIYTPNRPYIQGCLQRNASPSVLQLTAFQSGGGMSVVSNVYLVAPVAGLYQVGFNTIFNSDTGRRDLYIERNDTDIVVQTLSEDNGTGYHYRNVSVVLYMNANDNIRFRFADLSTGGTIYDGQATGVYELWRTFFFYFIG